MSTIVDTMVVETSRLIKSIVDLVVERSQLFK